MTSNVLLFMTDNYLTIIKSTLALPGRRNIFDFYPNQYLYILIYFLVIVLTINIYKLVIYHSPENLSTKCLSNLALNRIYFTDRNKKY